MQIHKKRVLESNETKDVKRETGAVLIDLVEVLRYNEDD